MQNLMIAFFFFFQSFLISNQSHDCNGPITANVIFQSKDGGRSWQDISAGLPLNFNA